ncbi:conserved membrane protein, unknown function, partial [Hepatocystis sp. ex Piliocolobus tephrosceles]
MNINRLGQSIWNSDIKNSLISSMCGTLASVFFKKGSLIFSAINNLGSINITFVEVIVRVFNFILFFIFNILMVKYYILLMKNNSAFLATILNFSLNFLLSAILGILFFNDKRNFFWVIGVIFILLGLVLSMTDTESEEKNKKGI